MITRSPAEQGFVVVRVPQGLAISGLVPVRAVLGCLGLLVATLAVTGAALMLGEVTFSPPEVARALFGDAARDVELFVVQWRLPRALAAAVFGAMLGVAGAIFQSVTRNPLGSPDIIGFTAGASAGGVMMIALVGSSYLLVTCGAVVGGLLVAVAVLLLARGGGVAGFRLVIVGIALSAMLNSAQTWIVLTADLELARVAAVWGSGSLNGASWAYTGPALVAGLVVMLLTGVLLSRPLGLLDLGEDSSAALGVPPGRTRLIAVLTGVLLVAIATAAAGPIAFVALAAPHVGRRVAGTSGASMAPAACAGAFLLASADLVAQHAIPDRSLPVGVVTIALGGLYLVSLLVRESRKGTL
ncbi:FecCD family ABC transporter permease [Aeromicrobium choanae]|uniref:Iron complex transport system permease protein n=1 Tax=Aeromicrobium choanae TaxID=1736691 RepID=A0A1T4Z6H4_9ACTN|nr:iron chelate uptake ABC transporter family permease subunit [Aeromicrobium choanae]SKB09468.1 iron complex transport system permease protein [Aeromicrobium choanae]